MDHKTTSYPGPNYHPTVYSEFSLPAYLLPLPNTLLPVPNFPIHLCNRPGVHVERVLGPPVQPGQNTIHVFSDFLHRSQLPPSPHNNNFRILRIQISFRLLDPRPQFIPIRDSQRDHSQRLEPTRLDSQRFPHNPLQFTLVSNRISLFNLKSHKPFLANLFRLYTKCGLFSHGHWIFDFLFFRG